MKFLASLAVGALALCVSDIARADEVTLGAHYVVTGPVASGTTATLIAASANTNGVSVKTLAVWAAVYPNGSTANQAQILALYPDGTQRIILMAYGPGANGAQIANPILLPAGVGLAIVCWTTAQCGAATTYDLH